jgi:hypothetical protein
MQAADPLAQLHPLREPPPPPWWPPAPGWWLLALLVLLTLAGLGWLWWRRYRERRYRREALARLAALHTDAAAYSDADFYAACNRLLKAVALRSFAQREVAALSGAAWVDFLNRSAPPRDQPLFDATFALQLYRPPTDHGSREELYRAARRWIRTHGATR